ncbi:SRPBCC family protein [Streptomyces sp. NPDC092296]|uniref:SRPBCC family protein n=1 Tax=Streptomyces sp. NPDC092296 TaxID=3366012 RepID=UPI00382C7680
MTEYEASRTMAALPELVYDEAADLRTMERWLPRDLHIEPQEPPAVTVSHGAEAERERALVRAEHDQLRVEWGTRDNGHYAGWLQVAGIGAGASEVTVHLSFFDPDTAPPGAQVEAALGQSLDRLADQVEMRADQP